MKKLIQLGNHYISDFLKNDQEYNGKTKHPLDLVLDEEIGAPRLVSVPEKETMWGKYWYRSGINNTMKKQLKDVVDEITSRINFTKNDLWLDIACNDGTLLNQVPDGYIKVGIDPADDSFYNESSKIATVIQDYFNYESYQKTGYGDHKAKIITTRAMFYDLINPHPFIDDVYKILEDDGVWVIQMSYTPLMIRQLAFDNICHEHAYYYSLMSIKKLMEMHKFKVVDCSLNDVNGGSFRVFLQKQNASFDSFSTQAVRDVCNYRIETILDYEKNNCDISDHLIWENFSKNIEELKIQTVNFIKSEKEKGKIICGYGASTKGNTLLQYFGLDNTLIDAIAERSPYKYGLKTIGTNIPIKSEDEVRAMNPDYMLVLPWHFIDEFIKREDAFLSSGGSFIVPCPKFKIIKK
jgi:hypothetical protein